MMACGRLPPLPRQTAVAADPPQHMHQQLRLPCACRLMQGPALRPVVRIRPRVLLLHLNAQILQRRVKNTQQLVK